MQQDDTDPTVIEGEEVDGEATVVTPPSDGSADVVLNMENLIKNHQLQIDQLQDQLKKHNDMLNDIFANESGYQAHVEKVKEANKAKNVVKEQILNRPEVKDLAMKVKGMRTDLKNLKEALSDYLGEYARMSGSNVIEGYDGELREIIYIAKLVRKTDKDR